MPNILSTTLKPLPCTLAKSIPYVQHDVKKIYTPTRTTTNGIVTGVSISNPSVINSPNHGLTVGMSVTIRGTSVTPSINVSHIITAVTTDSFTIPVNVTAVVVGTGTWTSRIDPYTIITSGGITAVSVSNPSIITSANHGLPVGALITIYNTSTTPNINRYYTISAVTTNTFSIPVDVTAVAVGTGTWIRRVKNINISLESKCNEFPFGVIQNTQSCSDSPWRAMATISTSSITAVSVANPSVITSVNHGLTTGTVVTIYGTTTTPNINTYHVITVLTANSFSIPINVTSVTVGTGSWIKRINNTNCCLPFGVVTNLQVPEDRLDMCNYPAYNSSQLEGLIIQRDALPPNAQGNILNPNDKSLWYQKVAIQSNMPASIPYTQHIRDTNNPFPTTYPEQEECCPPGKINPCSDCYIEDDDNCNSRSNCNYHPYPLSGPILKCSSVQSIPYTQHRICPIPMKSFGAINSSNFGNLLNYSIMLINNLVNTKLALKGFNTNVIHIGPTTGTINLTPTNLYMTIIHIIEPTAISVLLVLPTPADMCSFLRGIIGDQLTGKTFKFSISNSSNQNMTVTAVNPNIYNQWNPTPINNIISGGQSAEFEVFIESCLPSLEMYYVVRTNNYSVYA